MAKQIVSRQTARQTKAFIELLVAAKKNIRFKGYGYGVKIQFNLYRCIYIVFANKNMRIFYQMESKTRLYIIFIRVDL